MLILPNHTDIDHRVADILNRFPNILQEGVGEITDTTCSLKLKPETLRVYFAPQPVPYAFHMMSMCMAYSPETTVCSL